MFKLLWKFRVQSQDGDSAVTDKWQPFKGVNTTKVLKETALDIAGIPVTITSLRMAAESHVEQSASEAVQNALTFAEGHTNRIANERYRRNSSEKKIKPWENHIESLLDNPDFSCEDALFQRALDKKIEEKMKRSQQQWEMMIDKKVRDLAEADRRSKLPNRVGRERTKWSNEEDAELKRLVRRHGSRWKEIYDDSVLLQKRYDSNGRSGKSLPTLYRLLSSGQ